MSIEQAFCKWAFAWMYTTCSSWRLSCASRKTSRTASPFASMLDSMSADSGCSKSLIPGYDPINTLPGNRCCCTWEDSTLPLVQAIIIKLGFPDQQSPALLLACVWELCYEWFLGINTDIFSWDHLAVALTSSQVVWFKMVILLIWFMDWLQTDLGFAHDLTLLDILMVQLVW